jgi:hypothetical protein
VALLSSTGRGQRARRLYSQKYWHSRRIFSISARNKYAAVETVFSLVNALWKDKRNRLEVPAVKLIVLVKHHFRDCKCPEFHQFLL